MDYLTKAKDENYNYLTKGMVRFLEIVGKGLACFACAILTSRLQ